MSQVRRNLFVAHEKLLPQSLPATVRGRRRVCGLNPKVPLSKRSDSNDAHYESDPVSCPRARRNGRDTAVGRRRRLRLFRYNDRLWKCMDQDLQLYAAILTTG